MLTLMSLKRKITTAEDLRTIVRTMKVLAAISIRQYEQAVRSLRDYERTVEMALQVVLSHEPRLLHTALVAPRNAFGFVVFGSDQGMCGALNDQVVSRAQEELSRLETDRQWDLLVVGARAATRLLDSGHPVKEVLDSAGSIDAVLPLVQRLTSEIETWYTQEGVDNILLVFNRHLGGALYRPEVQHLLPIDRVWLQRLADKPWPGRSLPTFTMQVDSLLSGIIRQHLFVGLYRACAESLASEHASRLQAMQAAERNTEERLAEFQLLYHQVRHQAITSELLDIIAGVEAMSDSPAR